MFTGKFKRRTSTRAYTGPRASHAMESDDFFVVPRGLIEDASVVDLSLDMIAAANEALEGEVANATFIRFYSAADVNNDTRKADKADGTEGGKGAWFLTLSRAVGAPGKSVRGSRPSP